MGTVVILKLQEGSGTLTERLYLTLKEWILHEAEPGARLPSIRALAAENNLSRTTVEAAYSQLYAEGYIESRPRSGYFVAEDLLAVDRKPDEEPRAEKQNSIGMESVRYDFYPARLSPEIFPVKTWRRLSVRALQEDLDFGAYPDGKGEAGFREQIASYLNRIRGTRCRADQIVVCSGFIDAMGLAAELMQARKRPFAIEWPGYRLAERVMGEHGYRTLHLPVDPQGIDPERLEATEVGSLYLTPSHQYPTGVTLPVARRQALLEWARRQESWIVEDDYDSELNYTHRPIPAMQGLEGGERVLYLGTFSKSLSPAIRVAYLVLPEPLMERYRRSSHAHFARVSLPVQRTLELFMAEGHWERHLRRVRTLNRRRHDRMLAALKRELGDRIEIVTQGGGLAILVRSTDGCDLKRLREEAVKRGIRLYLASDFYGEEWEALRMGFGGLSEEAIDEGVAETAALWRALSMTHDR
ncbi:PLP-dependent aminotransferase family protein [Nitratifractor sp.]|uniref:MocR-like pyridoxine biosynthesis transcription factor PdxR n=1 Tax=Nitratifractor sp. TaxID=2268144 RepID=UPI0025CC81B4|nr:PLP-dependent aminotransferase family protein [Nitratifractor sp.]